MLRTYHYCSVSLCSQMRIKINDVLQNPSRGSLKHEAVNITG